ncbi:Fe-S protein assembly co-chaperone HscB [Paraburkholderia bonniea]|uniref:Fe-S protein assembly co-chaperone HscB n=1 Tax=Paraburkholderia bonniea TaxID=2152891 RepID=UPI00158114C1|nr:Fe-S protein assembly co-chaperone HscB [Paraburkholderia bonniea]WJF91389.1 Fe-S protein assembly co-chaperone HscB [Paraburkholderia bonniea]WJF94705.1 Fe-S protein assembly co-chaperone HscB [Paraburkholderia bonniea]
MNDSHFDLFDLPVQFALDTPTLERAYRTVQAQVHPDRFAAAADAQKRIAMQWATRTNEAYQTLRDPLKRAAYLLALRGVDLGAENNTAMEPAFLMQQIEWREDIEDAAAAKNFGALEALLARLSDEERARLAKLAALLDSGADQAAAEAVRQLMFIERVMAEAAAQIERLDG